MVLRSINLRRKIRPGRSTDGEGKFPRRDSSSRLVHVSLPFSFVMTMRISDFRSEVNDAKKMREVEGPSSSRVLWGP